MRTNALRVAWVLLLSLAVAAGGTPEQETEAGRKIYNESARSVLLLYTQAPDGTFVAQGSGFVIEGQKIVTNAHVASPGKPYVELGPARIPGSVKQLDVENDLAILTVDVQLTVRPLTLAAKAPKPGEQVYTISNPSGLERTISQGIVSGVREENGHKLLQITAPISHGSSGGPVFNSSGEVVGVIVGTIASGQNLNFAVPALSLANLLRASGTSSAHEVDQLLAQEKALREARASLKYSADPGSDYQQDSAEINSLLRKALDRSGTNAALLSRVWNEAYTEDNDIAIAAAQRAAGADPSAANHLALAKTLKWASIFKLPDEKARLLSEAEKSARSALQRSRVPPPDVQCTLGEILDDEGSYAEAEPFLLQALASSRRASDSDTEESAVRELIDCEYGLGKKSDGDRWFNLLASMGKASTFDWSSQGDRLREAKSFVEAGQAYTQAAVGGLKSAWCDAEKSYSLTSEDDSTLYCARECIEKETGVASSEPALARAHADIADILNKRGVYTEALNHAKEATSLDPSDGFYQSSLADALFGLHRNYEAVTAAKEAIRLTDGKWAFMHFRLGSAYFELQNWELARDSYLKAAELDKRDPASAYNVALCLQNLRYFTDAATWYEEYLRRKPDSTDRDEILGRIRTLRAR
jgi:tetratricopeptide (TPR) repeat protein